MTEESATPENEILLQGRAAGSPLRLYYHGKSISNFGILRTILPGNCPQGLRAKPVASATWLTVRRFNIET